MQILTKSWNAASKECVQNCFRKTGISPDHQASDFEDQNDQFRVFESAFGEFRSIDESLVAEDAEATNFLDSNIISVRQKEP